LLFTLLNLTALFYIKIFFIMLRPNWRFCL